MRIESVSNAYESVSNAYELSAYQLNACAEIELEGLAGGRPFLQVLDGGPPSNAT